MLGIEEGSLLAGADSGLPLGWGTFSAGAVTMCQLPITQLLLIWVQVNASTSSCLYLFCVLLLGNKSLHEPQRPESGEESSNSPFLTFFRAINSLSVHVRWLLSSLYLHGKMGDFVWVQHNYIFIWVSAGLLSRSEALNFFSFSPDSVLGCFGLVSWPMGKQTCFQRGFCVFTNLQKNYLHLTSTIANSSWTFLNVNSWN